MRHKEAKPKRLNSEIAALDPTGGASPYKISVGQLSQSLLLQVLVSFMQPYHCPGTELEQKRLVHTPKHTCENF